MIPLVLLIMLLLPWAVITACIVLLFLLAIVLEIVSAIRGAIGR